MACGNDNSYQYKPLNKAELEIRLLQFQNGPFQLENLGQRPLECTSRNVPIGERPAYRTLSYCWGDDTRYMPLFVDGKLLRITASLDIALRHLMLFRNLLVKPVWIDAICINQDDNAEKSWQVRMMKDIYLNAESSIGWVGLPDDISRLVMETVWEVALYKEFVFEFHKTDIMADLIPRIAADIVFSPAAGDLRRNAAVRLFLDKAFFSRTWIHQEVMVAKHLDLVCGAYVCDWNDLHVTEMSMAKHLGNSNFTQLDALHLMDFVQEIGPIVGTPGPKVFQLRFYFEENHLAYSLWSLVVLTRAGGAQCTNKRDTIYGVLSVAKDVKQLRISPYYDASVEECYTLAAKAFLKHGHLDVLIACQQPRSIANLPTWVPDFSTRWDEEHQVVTPIEHMGKATEDTVYGSLFCAATGSKPQIGIEKRGKLQLLCLGGVKFDTITAAASSFDQATVIEWKTPDSWQNAILEQVKGVLELISLSGSAFSEELELRWIETIIRVLTKNMEFGIRPGDKILHRLPPTTLRHSYVPYYSLLKRLQPITAFPTVGMKPEFTILNNMMLRRNIDRRAFITAKGNLGIGSAALEAGDVVAIIYGMDVPLLLRPCDGGYFKIIGESYVDGIMDGEAMSQSTTSMFEIC